MLWKSSLLLTTCFLFVAAGQEPANHQLSARELFYSAVQTPPAKPQPAPAAAPTKTTQKAARTEVASTNTPPPARPQPVETAPTAPPAQTASPARPSQPSSDSTSGARIVPASATVGSVSPSAGMPLGLKYSILKKSGDSMIEVPANSVFHAGDRIQINVQTNQPGYLYIISKGSSGTWKPMFPSSEVEDGNNRVDGFKTYIMPPKSRFLFDEQAGTEKLFVILARQPEPDLEKVIYSLQGGGAAPAPKKDEPAKNKPLLIMASARIDDMTVGRLRNAYSRDLVIEKVDESTPGPRKEDAVYVVNPTGSGDSRVVADLELVHQ